MHDFSNPRARYKLVKGDTVGQECYKIKAAVHIRPKFCWRTDTIVPLFYMFIGIYFPHFLNFRQICLWGSITFTTHPARILLSFTRRYNGYHYLLRNVTVSVNHWWFIDFIDGVISLTDTT